MAIYRVNISIGDEQGRIVSREVLFDELNETALLVTLGIYIAAYQALTQSGIISYTYSRAVQVNNAPGVGSNIDAGFTTLWATPLPIDPTTKVPDPVETIKDGQGGILIGSIPMLAWFATYQPGTARVNINNPQQPTAIRRATLDK